MRRVALAVAMVVLVLGACSGSDEPGEPGEPTDPPALGGIDGPARVDPSFDPFATTPASGTEAGG